MDQECRRCLQIKPSKSFYLNSRTKTGFEYICKECKAIVSASKRYDVSEETIEKLYSRQTCTACGENFKDRKDRHIHHINDTIRGVVCLSCNHILGQESEQDKSRIIDCLTYIHRNNLSNTVNPQERPISKEAVAESSETTRCGTLFCKQCERTNLQQSDFHKPGKYRKPRKICRECWNSNWRLRNKFKPLRDKATHCDCCRNKFTKVNKSCVHHIKDTVIGIVCNRCNSVLGCESPKRISQLQKCLEFMI